MPAAPRLSAITVDCADPARLAGFWGALLQREASVPLPGWLRLGAPGDPEPVLNFQPVPEAKTGKARIHLDLVVTDVTDAVATIERLGGRFSGERHDYDEGAVLVMADPEDNEFCIVQYY